MEEKKVDQAEADSTGLMLKQEKALAALLSERTLKGAAKRAGVSDVTLWRWTQDRAFLDRHREMRRQVVEFAIAQLQSYCLTATRVLIEIAEDANAPAHSRVTASRIIIEQSLSAFKLMDLQKRVEALEGLLAAVGGNKS